MKFSPRQLEVLKYVAIGKTYPEIGELLSMSPQTAKNHVIRMCDAAGAANRMGLVHRAYQLRLIELPEFRPNEDERRTRTREPVKVGEVEIHLRYSHAVLLREFMRRENRIFTLQNISDILGDSRLQDSTIRTHIMTLRKVLLQTRYDIQTAYGVGYRFIRIKG